MVEIVVLISLSDVSRDGGVLEYEFDGGNLVRSEIEFLEDSRDVFIVDFVLARVEAKFLEGGHSLHSFEDLGDAVRKQIVEAETEFEFLHVLQSFKHLHHALTVAIAQRVLVVVQSKFL